LPLEVVFLEADTVRTQRLCPSCNIGIMEYWVKGNESKRSVISSYSTVPSLHHSLTPPADYPQGQRIPIERAENSRNLGLELRAFLCYLKNVKK
jgi:hypothetical protein